MENMKKKAEALGMEIYDSDVYRSYLYYKNRVEGKTALKEKIGELKRMQFDQGLRRRRGEVVSLEEEAMLSQLYSEVTLDSDGSGFWESEKQLLAVMSEIIETVVAQAPIDFSYADEM